MRIVLVVLLVASGVFAHVRLLFPPARSPYDFTDVTRQNTVGPSAQKAAEGAITRGANDIERDWCGWKKFPTADVTQLEAGRETEVSLPFVVSTSITSSSTL
jgi:hypothetical protein